MKSTKKRLGNYFGDPIAGFFSDSDNRRVNALVLFDENSPMRDYFPWSSDFAESFRAAYGVRHPALDAAVLRREDVPQAVDYWEHAGRLMQGWFAAHHAWLRENGLQYTGHTSDSSPYLVQETQRSSCFTEGRFSDLERHFDYPGTDQEMYSLDSAKPTTRENFYTPHVIWGEREYMPKMTNFYDVSIDLRARQAASTAFQYGKKGVMCEMFAATNYGVSPAVLRQIAAYQLMQGVTFIVPHAYHHLFTGETKYFAPPDFFRRGHARPRYEAAERRAGAACVPSFARKARLSLRARRPHRVRVAGEVPFGRIFCGVCGAQPPAFTGSASATRKNFCRTNTVSAPPCMRASIFPKRPFAR